MTQRNVIRQGSAAWGVNEVDEAVTQTTDPAGSPSLLMNVLLRERERISQNDSMLGFSFLL
jgi:hypothetical protein